jgi:hypothetical protein
MNTGELPGSITKRPSKMMGRPKSTNLLSDAWIDLLTYELAISA